MADTGSDENSIREDSAVKFGLQVKGNDNLDHIFQLANGREVSSIGTVSASCSLESFGRWLDDTQNPTIKFHVFTRLAVPVIVGKKLLQATDTLTEHTGRLLIYQDNERHSISISKVLHMNYPQQRLRCYLDTDLVYANADTGSDLNLISPEFAEQRGLKIEAMTSNQSETVMLADGSTGELSGVFRARFYPFENPPSFTSHIRPPQEIFYVLEGLTTDVLIGAELLVETSAFTEQQSAFVDLDGQGICPISTL